MQSANPLFVMILVPALTWGVYPVLETVGLRISALRRISVGLILAAASYLVVGWLQHQIDANQETVSHAWQALPYLILTTAEVLVSTTGLEFAYTQAAPSMKGAIMSFWFLTMALGNLLVTTITQIGGQAGGNESVTPERFFLYAGIAAGVALLFMIVASCHRERQFHEVAHSKSRSD
jgi:POT family proton-dependent oligopeptide transporter